MSTKKNKKKKKKNLCVAIIDSSDLKNVLTANAQYAPVQAIIVTDHIWKKKKKSDKAVARKSYQYHLPKFTYT